MNLVLNNAALLPWLLLAAIPLLLHLFARSRPPAYSFSSTAFIARLKREATRIKRPHDWLLLLLRTLLFLVLAGVFLQPLLFGKRPPAGRFEQHNIVLIVDATASMAYADGAQSRFVAACAEAAAALSALGAGDQGNVIWLKHTPEAVLPELSGNTAYLRDALRQAHVSAGGGDPEQAIALATTLLAGAEGRREICIVSDFQKTGWDAFRPDLPPGIELIAIKVGGENSENSAITRLTLEPARPIAGEEVSVFCEVANFSPLPRRRTVYVEAGDTRLSTSVLVPAWGYAMASLPCRFPAAGITPVITSLDEDAFPTDNRRLAVATVDAHVSVGLLANDAATATAWKRAINALGWARVEPVTPADLEGGRTWNVLLLAGWDGSAAEAVARRTAAGTLVIASPGPSLAPSAFWRLTSSDIPPQAGPDIAFRLEERSELLPVHVTRKDDPLFAFFENEGIANPIHGGFRTRTLMLETVLPPGDNLLAFEDGIPALVRCRDLPLFIWNMPLDTAVTDWPKQSVFVLFMGELLNNHRRETQSTGRPELQPGEPFNVIPGRPLASASLALLRENGDALPVTEHFTDGVLELRAGNTDAPGLYTWRHGEETLAVDVVNVPVMESDLRTMDPPSLTEARTTIIQGGGRLKALHEGRILWPLLLGFCLCLAIGEGLVSWWSEWY